MAFGAINKALLGAEKALSVVTSVNPAAPKVLSKAPKVMIQTGKVDLRTSKSDGNPKKTANSVLAITTHSAKPHKILAKIVKEA